MKKSQNSVPFLVMKTECAEVPDNVKTGANAKAYRDKYRVYLKEVSEQIGEGASVSMLQRLEIGERTWSAEFAAEYQKAVDAVVKRRDGK